AAPLGPGGGRSGGEPEARHRPVPRRPPVPPLHVDPEVGFWLPPRPALPLSARLGFPLGASVEGAATLAPAGLARIGYTFGDGGGGIFVHGDLGAGFIRHVIKLTQNSALASSGDKDTFATGPLLAGGGAGWKKPLRGPVALHIDLNVLAGIPIISTVGSGTRPTKLGFAVNGDLSLGIVVAF